jgi:NAD-dependent DNA ligase
MNTSLVNGFSLIRPSNVSEAAPLSAFAEVVHTVLLLSLNNAFDDDEAHDFEKPQSVEKTSAGAFLFSRLP